MLRLGHHKVQHGSVSLARGPGTPGHQVAPLQPEVQGFVLCPGSATGGQKSGECAFIWDRNCVANGGLWLRKEPNSDPTLWAAEL